MGGTRVNLSGCRAGLKFSKLPRIKSIKWDTEKVLLSPLCVHFSSQLLETSIYAYSSVVGFDRGLMRDYACSKYSPTFPQSSIDLCECKSS